MWGLYLFLIVSYVLNIQNTYRNNKVSLRRVIFPCFLGSYILTGLKHESSMPYVLASQVTYPVNLPVSLNIWWNFAFVRGIGLMLGSKINKGFKLRILTAGATWNCHSTFIPFLAFSVSKNKCPKIKCFLGKSKFFSGYFSVRYSMRYSPNRYARSWHPETKR